MGISVLTYSKAPLCGANNNIEYYRILYATFSLPLTGRVDVGVLLVLIVRLEVVADLVVSVVAVVSVRERRTGNRTSPWKRPNTTVRQKTLKKVMKTWPLERLQSTSARKVVTPLLMTAGPMAVTAGL